MVKDYHWSSQAPRVFIAIGSCPKCCQPQLSKASYSEDDNVDSVAPATSSEVKGTEVDVEGTKVDQEELHCHQPES